MENKQYKGIIFDLDGVICHTDRYHYEAWKMLADRLEIPFDEKINNRLRGVSRNESLDIVLEKSSKVYTREEKLAMAEEKNDCYRKLLAQMTPADLSPAVKEMLDALKQSKKLAIGSSSKNTKFILERIGLDDYFDVIADGNDITHSKPVSWKCFYWRQRDLGFRLRNVWLSRTQRQALTQRLQEALTVRRSVTLPDTRKQPIHWMMLQN